MPPDRIDAHHHLWKYSPESYPWMSGGMDILRRDFGTEDLTATLRENNVAGTVAVQARQSLEETHWLLDLAEHTECIRGVVGWVPLTDPNVAKDLVMFSANTRLKGVRHVVHDESEDNYILRDDFNRGVALLSGLGLRYDILVFERQLPQTIRFVNRHPNQIFILDHIGKPRIKDHALAPWQANIKALAQRENVFCKLSGMVTEADWNCWTEDDLRPYFETVLNAFRPDRLMWGSDWPVVLLASPYARWMDVSLRMISELSSSEQRSILGATAANVYGLHP